jgi:hypothetical protein
MLPAGCCYMSCRTRALQQITSFPYVDTDVPYVANTYKLQLKFTSGGGSNVCFSLSLAAGTVLTDLCAAQSSWNLYSANLIGFGLQVGGCTPARMLLTAAAACMHTSCCFCAKHASARLLLALCWHCCVPQTPAASESA